MITREQVTIAGEFTKTHGIKGELSALLSVPVEYFEEHPMFICDIDGILVPFFIESIRPKGARSALFKPEDVNNDEKAKLFVGKDIYIIKETYMARDGSLDSEDANGAYADDLIGYTVTDEHSGELGVITDIEDSTANLLFIVRTPQDKTLYIPIAEPFINSINPDTKTVETTLPEGLVNLNA
ncbi:MAG: ribosome maturation factor RimM [Prevotella sp.]|nr:ribosome maturation factor RimM [Prevotella sp.]MCM1075554.1 ribosome maturation factor RimM [Ruminococcus sp.]